MPKNQFFIVGAQRSGTTYLYTILEEHPEICMAKPVKPEPKYFLQDNINISEYYNKYYNNCSNLTKVFGEKSTSYYENEKVAQKIATNLPLCKIVFILANPIDRAISNYKFSYENGIETRTLEEVFLEEKKIDTSKYKTSVNPFAYKERGFYHQYLEYYYTYFPKENIKVIIKENFTNNIESIQNLYAFLGLNSNFIPPSYNLVVNKSRNTVVYENLTEVRHKLSCFYKENNQILIDKFKLNIDKWNEK